MQELIQKVLNKEPIAALLAREVGRKANPELIELTRHEDAKVRRIAAYCLTETGGPDAVTAFVDLLQDNEPQVRAAALKGLDTHPDPVGFELLLTVYDRSPEAYVRQQIMLVLGKMPSGVDVKEMKTRYYREHNNEAKEGSIVALARLNDLEARGDFIRLLHASQGRDRARFLEHCKYINAPWLQKALLPILDDKSNLVWIGVDAHPEWPRYLRACDMAINLIASIGRRTFSFPVKGGINYTDPQISEVKEHVKSLY